ADEGPGGRRAGRFPPRHRRPGATVSGSSPTRPLRRHGLRLPQSPSDGAEAADLRWPGVLAVPQTAVAGSLPVVARGQGRRCPAPGRPPPGGTARGRRPHPHGDGGRLASRRPARLTRPPLGSCPQLLLPDRTNLAPLVSTPRSDAGRTGAAGAA